MRAAGQAASRGETFDTDCVGRGSAIYERLDYAAKQAFHTENHAALKAAFEELQAAGVNGLYYIPGDHLYGDDTEGATDASHANDLGFMRQADVFEPILRTALTGSAVSPNRLATGVRAGCCRAAQSVG